VSFVQSEQGSWRCGRCGAQLGIPPAASPYVVFITEASYRAIVFRGQEIHRCAIEPDDDPPTENWRFRLEREQGKAESRERGRSS
jgi:hypothetical protein